MSTVTNIILAYGLCRNDERDHALLEEINAMCDVGKVTHVEDSRLPDGWCYNGKALEVNLAIGAFNHLNLQEWVGKIRQIDFNAYDCDFIQLIVQDQESVGFGIINVWDSGYSSPFEWGVK